MPELKNEFAPEIVEKIGETEAGKKSAPKKKKNPWKIPLKLAAYAVIFLTVSIFLFANRVNISEQTDSFFGKLSLFGSIRHLVSGSERELKGEKMGRINILLLGIGGKGHDGAYLTDTIMLVSLDPENKKIAMLSLPRDMSIPVEDSTAWTKINNINAYAEAKEPGSGGMAISQAVSDILEIPIDYYVRADFDGFKNIIDKIGGVEVNVENTLDDYSYPAEGQEDNPDYFARFDHLHIDKGWQKMDGELALKYARSRHGAGIEGSDFARARRQQLVLEATKDKLLKASTILNPITLTGIIDELSNHISTNLKVWEMIKLWSTFKDIDRENIINKVLDNSAKGLLYATINEQGVYVLLPKNGDFSEIKYLAQNIFATAPKEEKKNVVTERSTLEILNGTWINGLANRSSTDLEKYGFDVIAVANCTRRNFERSTIYDLTQGEKIKSLSILKEKTGATVSFELPQWLKDDLAAEIDKDPKKEKPNFVLILGQDADKTETGAANKE